MQSKSKSLNKDWLTSFALHGLVAVGALMIFRNHDRTPRRSVDVEVLEVPKAAPKVVQITQPKKEKALPVQHQVFGASRKSITSEQGEAVKMGNTLAKAPDQEVLKPGDRDSLPVPSEEYLVTKMPSLKNEVRIPYPPDAKKKGIEGAVVMDLLIDSSGFVREVKLIEGPNDSLNAAAVSATRDFQFTPALIQDKPVAVRIRYAYRFVLEHG